MRAAAIDLGTTRIGFAVSDELGQLAHPRPYLPAASSGQLVEKLATLAQQEQIQVFVVGLPRTLDGREGPLARRARKVAAALKRRIGCRVVLVDERLSTAQAHSQLMTLGFDAKERKGKVDSVAAALLLQTFLDAGEAGNTA
ncbi:MAG TPA: Holliday junction resolvase RuvX [Polyangiaceae bacterium]|nr:Holliday junction resolvase RuvX [Polyangiaceae bacterium]